MCDDNKTQPMSQLARDALGQGIGPSLARLASDTRGTASKEMNIKDRGRDPQYTPLLVQTMIELRVCPSEALPKLVTSRYPQQQEILDLLIRAGIIRRYEGVDSFQCDVNKEALRVYVDELCRVPLPIQSWRIP